VAAILQAARTLGTEVSGNQRVGSVDDAVVAEKRKRTTRGTKSWLRFSLG